jgi:hypothetical protein
VKLSTDLIFCKLFLSSKDKVFYCARYLNFIILDRFGRSNIQCTFHFIFNRFLFGFEIDNETDNFIKKHRETLLQCYVVSLFRRFDVSLFRRFDVSMFLEELSSASQKSWLRKQIIVCCVRTRKKFIRINDIDFLFKITLFFPPIKTTKS